MIDDASGEARAVQQDKETLIQNIGRTQREIRRARAHSANIHHVTQSITSKVRWLRKNMHRSVQGRRDAMKQQSRLRATSIEISKQVEERARQALSIKLEAKGDLDAAGASKQTTAVADLSRF